MSPALALCLAVVLQITAPRVGVASWYGHPFHGRLTASGTVYNMTELTCAHRTLPLGTLLLVDAGRKPVQARVTDRGPYVDGRELDLSAAAFAAVCGDTGRGLVRVKYRVTGRWTDVMRYNLRGGRW